MRKYFTLLAIVLFAVVAMAQERTVDIPMKTGVFYIQHASKADTLIETNQDTIDFVFENQNREAIEKLIFSASIDTIAGNDSISYVVTGFNNPGATETSITTGGLLIDQNNELVEISKWYWTNDTTYVDLNYRFYRLRVIQLANNDYDGGAKFDYLRLQLRVK
jgi:hypothetical protein